MGIVPNVLFLYILSASCIYLALWLVTCRLACFVIIITSDFRRSLGWLDLVVHMRIATCDVTLRTCPLHSRFIFRPPLVLLYFLLCTALQRHCLRDRFRSQLPSLVLCTALLGRSHEHLHCCSSNQAVRSQGCKGTLCSRHSDLCL